MSFPEKLGHWLADPILQLRYRRRLRTWNSFGRRDYWADFTRWERHVFGNNIDRNQYRTAEDWREPITDKTGAAKQ